jgi:hypothetical protein
LTINILQSLKNIKPCSIIEILQNVHAITKQSQEIENISPPKITLGLKTGNILDGWLLDASFDIPDKQMLIISRPENSRMSDTLAFISLQDIMWVEVHNIGNNIEGLLKGKIDPLDTAEPVNLLSLRREIQSIENKISERFGQKISFKIKHEKLEELSPKERSALLEISKFIDLSCEGLSKNEFSRNEFNNKITSIILEKGESKKVQLIKKELAILFDFNASIDNRFSFEEINNEFNRIL